MATNLRTEDLLPASVAPMRILAGLYRSTFVDKLQERFRLMLASAYAAYVTALGEGFDPALRAHLTDVLQDINTRTSELTELFEEELMGFLQATMEQFGAQDAAVGRIGELRQPGRANLSSRIDDEIEIKEFIAKTTRSIETRHGSIILAVTKTYINLTGQSVEDFRPPWTPSNLFSAFAAVLQQVEVPIHGRVKLVLYKMFSQDVLRHIGDACLAFRDVLPGKLSELNIPERGIASALASASAADGYLLTGTDSSAATETDAGFSRLMPASGLEDVTGAVSSPPDTWASGSECPNGEGLTLKFRQWNAGKLIRIALILFGGVAIVVWGGWWRGAHLPKTEPSSNQIDEKSIKTEEKPLAENVSPDPPKETPALPVQPLMAEPSPELPPPVQAMAEASEAAKTASEQAMPILPPKPVGIPPRSQADSRAKREALRAVKLKNFAWKVGSSRKEMLFDLTIMNAGKTRVGGIEVVCSQYSKALDFLESGKTVLTEPIEPGQVRTFRAVPIGFASKKASRAHCVIADLDIKAAK
jgi:hypothetical protein